MAAGATPGRREITSGERAVALPNGETETMAQQVNDDACERTKHGARHVEVGGASLASESARGDRHAKPPVNCELRRTDTDAAIKGGRA